MARRPSCDFSRIEQAGVYPSLLLHICFSLDLVLQLLLKVLILSLSAHSHAVRLEIPHPLPTARVPTIVLLSRGLSCCCTSQPRRDTTLPACSYAFTIGTFRRWWYSSPPCCTAMDAHRTLLVPRLGLCWSSSQPANSSRARPCSNILAHEAAPGPNFRVSLECS